MDQAKLKKAILARELGPIYLLWGDDAPNRDKMALEIVATIDEGIADFNLNRVLADETSPAEVTEMANTMPFMGPPRVVVVKGVDRYSAEDLHLLHTYAQSPNESTCLVLVGQKPNFSYKLFKYLKASKQTVSFEAPRKQGLIAWVRQAMSQRGLDMNEAAARTLVDMVGPDLEALDGEVEKLSLYALGERRVEVEDVKTVARLCPTANVFQLGDAVGSQNPARAAAALNDLVAGEATMMILAMLVRHFRLLLKVTGYMDQRLGPGDMASGLRLPPFVVKSYVNQARELGAVQIKKGLSRLEEAELAVRSSPAPGRLILESLVLDLASLKPGRRSEPYEPF